MIEIDKVSFSYNDAYVIDQLSFFFEDNRIYGVVGPNGSGKSTLLKLMLGVLTNNNGEIYLNGKKISTYPKRDLAKIIAYVPQHFPLQFDYTVKDIILMGRFPYRKSLQNYTQEDYKTVEKIMEQLEINQYQNTYYSELSGGEKQRVSIARALAQETEILLLDESFANLDLKHHQMIIKKLRELHSQKTKLIILVSHNVNLISEICNVMIMMKDGKICKWGKPSECIQKKWIEEIYETEMNIIQNPQSGKPNIMYKL